MNKKREYYVDHLRKIFQGQLSAIEEYIREVEHLEGESYWDMFEEVREAEIDFKAYQEYMEEVQND